jgi:hypothetical protein
MSWVLAVGVLCQQYLQIFTYSSWGIRFATNLILTEYVAVSDILMIF